MIEYSYDFFGDAASLTHPMFQSLFGGLFRICQHAWRQLKGLAEIHSWRADLLCFLEYRLAMHQPEQQARKRPSSAREVAAFLGKREEDSKLTAEWFRPTGINAARRQVCRVESRAV